MFSFIRFFKRRYYYFRNFCSFFLMGVKFRGLTVNGILFFRCYGDFIYGKSITINSTFSANPIGGNSFCSIVICKNGTLNIGDKVGISNSAIYCTNNITIMDNVLIGGDCKIYDTDFHPLNIDARLKGNNKGISKPVLIKSGAFVGTGSIILKGTVIGENSIIGAGSVVSGTIPDNEIWGGNPARFIRSV